MCSSRYSVGYSRVICPGERLSKPPHIPSDPFSASLLAPNCFLFPERDGTHLTIIGVVMPDAFKSWSVKTCYAGSTALTKRYNN